MAKKYEIQAPEDVTFTMDQVAIILKTAQELAYEQGKLYAQHQIGDFMERMNNYPCLKPNWTQIASDIRAGKVVGDA